VDSELYPGCAPLTILEPYGPTQLYLNNCANPSYQDVLILPVLAKTGFCSTERPPMA
jgi:hypothetical protein